MIMKKMKALPAAQHSRGQGVIYRIKQEITYSKEPRRKLPIQQLKLVLLQCIYF